MGCAQAMPTQWLDICDGNHKNPETQVSIQKFYYFEDLWGRKSALEFMMDYCGLHFEVTRLNAIAYYTVGYKEKLGGLPVAQRTDGFLMNETHPIARYIARHNGLYPEAPLERFWNDKIAMDYDPIINSVFLWATLLGSKKEA